MKKNRSSKIIKSFLIAVAFIFALSYKSVDAKIIGGKAPVLKSFSITNSTVQKNGKLKFSIDYDNTEKMDTIWVCFESKNDEDKVICLNDGSYLNTEENTIIIKDHLPVGDYKIESVQLMPSENSATYTSDAVYVNTADYGKYNVDTSKPHDIYPFDFSNITVKVCSVSYTTHVQDYGWQDFVESGDMSGTSGKSKRLEAIKVRLQNLPYAGNIEYRTHIQDIGWEKTFKKNGEMSGTSKQSKRLEAIEMKLTGEVAEHYDIYYRVHAQDVGWMNWAKNGEQAGTAGYGRRLEGIEIELVEKGKTPTNKTDIKTTKAFLKKQVSYRTHVQDYGWQGEVADGEMSGTKGQSKRLEGIKIKLNNPDASGNIEYKTHIQDIGWEKSFKKNGEMSGTSHQSKRLEAIQIKLTGAMADKYDIYYRVHAQNFGWMDWAKNGESAGTAHYSYRLEGIEVVLVEKGGTAPTRTDIRVKESFVDKNQNNILHGSEAIETAKKLYDKASSIYFSCRGKTEMKKTADNTYQYVFYKKNNDGSFTVVDFYQNQEISYLKLVIKDVTDVLTTNLFQDFITKCGIIEYNGNYYTAAGDRGGNLSYWGYDMAIKSVEQSKIEFVVTSYYRTSNQYLNFDKRYAIKKTDDLVIKKESGSWKVDKFTLAY